MQTTFTRWLDARGEAPYAFANRFGISKEGIYRLAGVGREPRKIRYFKKDFLLLVSGETGIPAETLIEDATRAAANPTPPRKYVKKTESLRAAVAALRAVPGSGWKDIEDPLAELRRLRRD